MNLNKKLIAGAAGLLAAGTFAVGVASAAGTDTGTGTGTGTTVPPTSIVAGKHLPKLTPAEKCAKQDEIAARVATAKQRIADRKAKLEARRVTAVANGNTQAVTRIDQRLARLQKISDRIDARYARYQKWVAANCSTTK
jgi:hypothetical protein